MLALAPELLTNDAPDSDEGDREGVYWLYTGSQSPGAPRQSASGKLLSRWRALPRRCSFIRPQGGARALVLNAASRNCRSLVYPHDWNEKDLVLFHNRGVLHTVVGAFAEDQVRGFHQCNLAASDDPAGPSNEDVLKWA
ncbi:hypothetical protein C8F01DRAFT_627122 [Mycena amicta]|nr:hypothetical protein C8F01DRAFT_627122 [Mycena amicta]